MRQKHLLHSLHSYVLAIELKGNPEFNLDSLKLTADAENAVKPLYNLIKDNEHMTSSLLSNLQTLAEKLDPEELPTDDQSILNVLYAPNLTNIKVLIDAAQKLDDDYREKNGSLGNLMKEGALTCAKVVWFLLVSIASVIVFPLALIISLFSATSVFSSTSAPMAYGQFVMDTFLAIGDSVEHTEDAYDALTYDSNAAVANNLISSINFFKPKSETAPDAFLNTLHFLAS